MILFVCEGNVCRSVLAEALLRDALPPELGVTVGSAGVSALIGAPADDHTSTIAERFGVSLKGHSGTQMTAELLAEADMVLAATRKIRSSAVQVYPPAVQYSFTIRQLARILESATGEFDAGGLTGGEIVRCLVRSANQERGRLVAPAGKDDDIPDPHAQPMKIHEHVAQMIVAAIDRLSRTLGGPRVPWVPLPSRSKMARATG